MSLFWAVLFLLFGFFLLIKAADIMVEGAAALAKKLNIPKMVIGLTLVAFGTSAPEGTVSVIAALQGSPDLALGNVLGSNVANIALILGIAAFLHAIPVQRGTLTKGLPLGILSIIVLFVMGYDQFFQNHGVDYNRLTLGDGVLLLSFFIIFLYYIFGDMKAAQVLEEDIEKKQRHGFRESTAYLVIMVLGGLAGILVGGKLVVDHAIQIAQFFGLSDAFIGLTIVAIGTSLPELVSVVTAARKKENDIAIGTIVGSNIFNVFLVLGLTSVISPIEYDPLLVVDTFAAFFVALILYVFLLKDRQLTKVAGSVLLVLYVFYLTSIAFRESVLAFFGS